MKRSISLFIAVAAFGIFGCMEAAGQQPIENSSADAPKEEEPVYRATETPEPHGLPESSPRSGDTGQYPPLNELRAAAQASAQNPGDDGLAPSPAGANRGSLLQAMISLAVVVAAILLLYALLRRLGSRNPLVSAGGGQILGRTYLAPKASLHFVRVGDRVLVVGVTPQQVNLVTEVDAALLEAAAEPEPVPFSPRTSSARSFGRVLKRLWDRLPSPTPPARAPEPRQEYAEEPDLTPRQTPALRRGPQRENSGDDLAALQLELRRLQRRIEETRHAARE